MRVLAGAPIYTDCEWEVIIELADWSDERYELYRVAVSVDDGGMGMITRITFMSSIARCRLVNRSQKKFHHGLTLIFSRKGEIMRYTGKTLQTFAFDVNMKVLKAVGYNAKVVQRDSEIYPKHQWGVRFVNRDGAIIWESWYGTPREAAGYLLHELGKRGLYEKCRHACWEHIQRIGEW